MNNVPVTAIKSYLGHSLAAAGGDQLISALGSFETGLIPKIASIKQTAEDVYTDSLDFVLENRPCNEMQFVILNSKGFGGNNASALIASKSNTFSMLQNKHGKDAITNWHCLNEEVEKNREEFKKEVLCNVPSSRYIFGEQVTEGISDLDFTKEAIFDRTNDKVMSILSELPFEEYTK